MKLGLKEARTSVSYLACRTSILLCHLMSGMLNLAAESPESSQHLSLEC